jgi:hypothetical protein
MNEQMFRRMLRQEKPKPSGKDAKRIRKMLREGIPPASMHFDPLEIDKIYAKLPIKDRQRIIKRVVAQKVELNVTEEQVDKVIQATIVSETRKAERIAGVFHAATEPNRENTSEQYEKAKATLDWRK